MDCIFTSGRKNNLFASFLIVLIALVGTACVLYAIFSSAIDGSKVGAGVVAFALAIVQVLLIAGTSIHTVDARNVGVVRSFGSISGQVGEGVQLTWPWQSVEEWDVREQTIVIEMEAGSKEGQLVLLKVLINLDVSPDNVQNLARDIGRNYEERIIRPRSIQAIKEIVNDHVGLDVLNNRDVIRSAAEDRLKVEFAPYSLTLRSVILEDIDFSDEFNATLEKKASTAQQIEVEKNLVEVAKQQANQAEEAATGRSKALSAEAAGQAEANRLISSSLTPALIQFQAIQKLNDNISIALVPGEGNILGLGNILAQP